MKNIATQIREARQVQGISLKELAEKTGINRSNLSRIENGTLDPRVSTIKTIANALQRNFIIEIAQI